MKTGPDPAGRPPWARSSATASAHGGVSSPRGVPDGARFAGTPSGILRSPGRSGGISLGRSALHPVASGRTTQQGVTGFDFSG